MNTNTIPRQEYPRPQFVRDEWINLNGNWSYEFDFSESGNDDERWSPAGPLANNWNGASRNLKDYGLFSNNIVVPFCPESTLSRVGYTDFIPAMYYARKITIPAKWENKRIILHFGGVDNITTVYIDGQYAGRHKGGQCSFSFDITDFIEIEKEHTLTVYVVDHQRDGLSGSGKQSWFNKSYGCCYTRVTGIWSTVWLEPVDKTGLKRCKITPDYDNGAFIFTPEYYALDIKGKLVTEIFANGTLVASSSVTPGNGIPFILTPSVKKEWNPDDPFLYDIKFSLFDASGKLIDSVSSYAGLRKISIIGDKIYLNNEPFYPRFVLDQGYYPDGIWTAPSDEALENDIKLAKAAGFNGARLHQKVFEERFHYHADKLGYLTWGEYGNWGLRFAEPRARENFLEEWREIVLRDINHPSIIVWCPLNESTPPGDLSLARSFPYQAMLHQYQDWVKAIYNLTHSIDPTRPINDASGFLHVITDIWSVHCYSKDLDDMISRLLPENGKVMIHAPSVETGFNNQPYLCNEFGGFKYVSPNRRLNDDSWGYHGLDLETPEALADKIAEQVNWLISAPQIGGYCYTQLTDIEQEQNGLYNYDRSEKFPIEIVQKIFSKKPIWSKF